MDDDATRPRDEVLRELRGVLTHLRTSGGRGVPAPMLARLASELGALGLTLDLDAAEQLGQPMVVLRVAADTTPAPCFDTLTPRELEVAELVAAGLRNADVALALGIRVSTVKDHVHRILHKTGLDGRAQVAAAWRGG
jgi:DNA-binding NarL/FixJ family response regulator